MHSSVPERIRPAAAAMASACVLALIATLVPMLPPTAVTAANNLHDGTVSPGSGTTSTTFLFSVVHSSAPQENTPESVTLGVADLSLPMLLVSGDDPKTGLTYQTSTELPAGTWTATFTAVVPGGNPAPYELAQRIIVTAPTPPPTPSPTPPPPPPPTPSATSRPTPIPTPLPPGVTPRPTPLPTPLPPGVTPGPATPSPSPTRARSDAPAASGSPDSSPPASPEAETEDPSLDASSSPTASAREAELSGSRGGIGRLGWVVLGGMTSVAGAFVLVRQWLARRRSTG